MYTDSGNRRFPTTSGCPLSSFSSTDSRLPFEYAMSTSEKMMYLPVEFRMPFRIEYPFPMFRGFRSTVIAGDAGLQPSQDRQRLVETSIVDNQYLVWAMDAVEECDKFEESLLEVPGSVVTTEYQ
jgi:hypothetical protein